MSGKFKYNNLFIFEMANNHMGSLKHGLRIVREVKKVCRGFNFNFAFKLQYRDLATFIHPDARARKTAKYVRRFEETKLNEKEFLALREEIRAQGFLAVCTPFDELSVELAEKHDFDIIKIGSCSFNDWPLLERLASVDKPMIFSLGGASLEGIDKTIAFLEHRNKAFCLMHCVSQYPAAQQELQLNQIDFIRKRYPGIPVGYSTHEDPAVLDPVKLAVAKGATIFERHVAVKSGRYPLNQYSSTPLQLKKWLAAAEQAFILCGRDSNDRYVSEKEISSLRQLKRGVFAREAIQKGQRISLSNTFLAIPNAGGQLTAEDLSKYTDFYAKNDLKRNAPVFSSGVDAVNLRGKVLKIIKGVKDMIIESRISLSDKVDLELSHHYGIDNFHKFGAVIINCINREYCKKIIVMLPGQVHPDHYHGKKEETFHILFGCMRLNLNGSEKDYRAGEMVIIERGVKHGFSSKDGVVFEEISTTSFDGDSFYDDAAVTSNRNRKTYITLWHDWRIKPVL